MFDFIGMECFFEEDVGVGVFGVWVYVVVCDVEEFGVQFDGVVDQGDCFVVGYLVLGVL